MAGLAIIDLSEAGNQPFASGLFFADLLVRGRLGELRRELGANRSLHGASAATAALALARPFLPERIKRLARARVRGSAALVHPALGSWSSCSRCRPGS